MNNQERDNEIKEMYYVHGMRMRAIADRMNLSLARVGQIINNAKWDGMEDDELGRLLIKHQQGESSAVVKRAYRILKRAGIDTVQDFFRTDIIDLVFVSNAGKVTIGFLYGIQKKYKAHPSE